MPLPTLPPSSLRLQLATKSIVLPVHTEAAQGAYYSVDKTSINEGIANIFINIAEELEDVMDFQLREVELPSCDPGACSIWRQQVSDCPNAVPRPYRRNQEVLLLVLPHCRLQTACRGTRLC